MVLILFRSSILNYSETLDYLYNRLPMFTRIGKAAYKGNLDNTHQLMDMLGHPEKKLKCIHVAGTNGKGSTSHFFASILQEAGYKTGLYTSPHLKDFRERIRMNGNMIPENEVVDFTEKFKSKFEVIEPSFFELTVAMCFWWFEKEQPDICIIETGLGGRLDSTNVIHPLLSVITNIGLDHTDLLGKTLPLIAAEKAGIIKPERTVVIGERNPETDSVFLAKAKEMNAGLYFAEDNWKIENVEFIEENMVANISNQKTSIFKNISSGLNGIYQKKNLITVMQAIEILQQQDWNISEQNIRYGLLKVKENTGLMGRWQVLRQNPLTIADTAHNVDSVALVMLQLSQTPHQKLHIVWGMVADKDISGVLALLPKEAAYYFCNANLPRALPATELAKQANQFELKGNGYETVAEAYSSALNAADKEDLIFVGGSTFVVGEVV